jgi:hypothetical protein
MESTSLCSVTEPFLVEAISRAKSRLVLVAPGASEAIARAVAAVWAWLGPERVTVVLDVDPEELNKSLAWASGCEPPYCPG